MINSELLSLSPEEMMKGLAERLKKRRLEKGISRAMLHILAGVPVPTITRFEMSGRISLESFVKLASALGYADELNALFREAKFSTMEEMETIKRNSGRQRGCRRQSTGN